MRPLRDDLSEEELGRLAQEGTDEEKRVVAMHPNTSLETLLSLAGEGFANDVDQNPMLLLHTEVGSEEVILILEKVAEQIQQGERLDELASSVWDEVRRGVAWNQNTPPTSLSLLAKDQDEEVRRAVARNTSTPSVALSLLAMDQDEYVRRFVARNADTPLVILSLLAMDQEVYVRHGVATNTSTPPATLSILNKDPNENDEVRKAAHETLAKLKKRAR